MLITFTTKTYADITLFGDIGISMLKMMGHSGTVPGAILAKDVPTALNALRNAVSKVAPPAVNDLEEDEEPSVSIQHRALPLIELLSAAAKAGSDVMWK
tara:strand:+ start:927 stop:1223 length:297 start_codon:yes stop_codon:yes gene_type:complete